MKERRDRLAGVVFISLMIALIFSTANLFVIMSQGSNQLKFKEKTSESVKTSQTPQMSQTPSPPPLLTKQGSFIQTYNAIQITSKSASLIGNIDGNDFVYYWFEWGSNSSLENVTSKIFGLGNVCQTISGLQPETIYFFRIVMQTNEKITHGQVRTLMTEPDRLF